MTPNDAPEFRRELEDAKLRALVEFAAGAGHEINNPVATIVGYAQQLLLSETDPERRRMLATIGGQAYRIRDMIGDVMLFARPPQPRPQPLELGEVCREVAAKFSDDAVAKSSSLDVECPVPVPIHADPMQLRVALGALIRNSLEAIEQNGRIVISAATEERDRRAWAVVHVKDNGRGLSPAVREHLFDPFYSGRQAGRGLGFGLSKAWRIVTLHGGRIDVDSPSEGVAVFVVWWPAFPSNVG
jgi:signal transduction histidine kinase